MHDGKTKLRRSPSKTSPAKRTPSKDRVRAKKVEAEKNTRVEDEGLDAPPDGWPLRRVISIEEDHLPHLLHGGPKPLLHQLSEEEDQEVEEVGEDEEEVEALSDLESSTVTAPARLFSQLSLHVSEEAQSVKKSGFKNLKKAPTSARGQPVGKETQQVRLGKN